MQICWSVFLCAQIFICCCLSNVLYYILEKILDAVDNQQKIWEKGEMVCEF